MPRTFYDVKRIPASVSRSCASVWRGGVSDTEGKIWRTEKGRSKSRTHVGVVVDFGGGLSGDLSLGGDGKGHALHLRSGGWYGRRFESERCSRFGIGCPRGLRVPGEKKKKKRAHSPRPSARHGGTRRPYRAQPGGSLWMGGYQRGCVSQSVYESIESAVASGRNDVTPTVRSAGDRTSERKTGQKIGNARRRTHRTWRGRRRTRKWAPGRAWRQPAFSLDRRVTRGVLRADGIWFFGAVPHPVFF